ncbi:energy-coupling factor transporter transmembrane component T family protein [Alteribacter keqinensis]|uniref:Energy-coupling factor transporter transmembrane protein EcfT n=1 Tax=Alteribacter keqinensis TaxID=2483800 RepID=A0A3M7TKW5_9BACI|nr:energy-coupling factor transporter transmembrane protein EcfT [Alteribacter keqinensis]RNA66199.1 energy-coupling factor transporter transmembrane protein EcfT [Alteribacter keqinensis]
MFDNIIIGQYVPRESVIHRMDPRAKLICLFVFMIVLFVGNRITALVPGIFFVMAAFLLAQIPLRFFAKGLRIIAIIIFITFILHLFMTREGDVLFQGGWITLHEGALTQASLIALRLLLLVILASMLTLTTTPIDLTDGLEKLFGPLKKIGVPAHELALTMSIALRFIPTLLGETEKIVKAQMARGASFSEGSLVKRAKALVPLLVPLLIQSFKRAEDLATAMEARGYDGSANRTKYRQLHWKRSDTLMLVITVLTGVVIFLLRG